MNLKNKLQACILGHTVADALGVPVEFTRRSKLRENPVIDMREFGVHNQPRGTWSDDSSMMFMLMQSLLDGYDLKRLGGMFVNWIEYGYWTPHGDVFDAGNATRDAVRRLKKGGPPEKAGRTDMKANGNGALMRIAPLAFYTLGWAPEERKQIVQDVGTVTHGHEISIIACFIYNEIMQGLIEGIEPAAALIKAKALAAKLYADSEFLERVLEFLRDDVGDMRETDLQSGGFVLDTLRTSLWCIMTESSYGACVLKAVNLGDDTDTTAAVTGSMAGIVFGREDIPEEWVNVLVKKEEILTLMENFLRLIT